MPFRLPKAWGNSFDWAVLSWLIATILSGIVVYEAPHFTLAYLIISVLFWLSSFPYALTESNPSLIQKALISIGPLLLFGITVAIQLFHWR